ncbi:MAG: hypothetical protein ACT4N5_04505 [Nitrosopumilaceae archaeon]
MLPKGAFIGFGIGVIISAITGFLLLSASNQSDVLVYVEGPSISILTEKTNFKIGEEIVIKVVNSGSVPLTFSDSSYGLKIIGLDGLLLYSPQSTQMNYTLQPKEEKMFTWNQKKSDGDQIIEGRYKIVTDTIQDGKKIEKSLTINILK